MNYAVAHLHVSRITILMSYPVCNLIKSKINSAKIECNMILSINNFQPGVGSIAALSSPPGSLLTSGSPTRSSSI